MFEGFVDETPPAVGGHAGASPVVVPGPELADRLLGEELLAPRPDPADHSPGGEAVWQAADAEGLGRIEGWSRLTAWVQAQEMLSVEGLVTRTVERAEQRPPGTPLEEHVAGVSAEVDSVVAELALVWRVATRTAARRVDEAVSLVNGLPLLIEAMLDGRLTLAHVRALGGVLLDLDPALVERICRDLLESTSAGTPVSRTPAQLAASARRTAIRLDPSSERRRERAAARERGVHLGAEDHGMATVTAYLPAAEALLLYRTIDAHARRAAPADATEPPVPEESAESQDEESTERSPDARRADALCDLVGLGALLAAGARPEPIADPGDPGADGRRAPHDPPAAGENGTASASSASAGTGTEPADVQRSSSEPTDVPGSDTEPTHAQRPDTQPTDARGTGAGTPDTPRSDTASARAGAGASPSRSDRSGPCTCLPRTRGLDPRLTRTQLEQIADPPERAARSMADPRTTGPGREPGSPPTPGRRPPRPARNVQVRVVVSADTLLGLDDRPAELTGYGPITAAAARALAADTDATWRRVLTDPVSGAVLDVGHRRYRPPAAMAEHVRNRDLTCTFPGCRVPAEACDLDHLVPYDPGDPDGHTAVDNLDPDCRHHHRIKHLPGWRVARMPDGSVLWTTPSGRRYRTIRPVLMPATYDADPTPRPPGRSSPRADSGGTAATDMAATTVGAPGHPDQDLDHRLRRPNGATAGHGRDDDPPF